NHTSAEGPKHEDCTGGLDDQARPGTGNRSAIAARRTLYVKVPARALAPGVDADSDSRPRISRPGIGRRVLNAMKLLALFTGLSLRLFTLRDQLGSWHGALTCSVAGARGRYCCAPPERRRVQAPAALSGGETRAGEANRLDRGSPDRRVDCVHAGRG